MHLSALPDLRAAQAPDAPAVADDTIDLNNTQFLDAVRRASAVHARTRRVGPVTWSRSCCPTGPASSWRCSRRGAWARRSRRSTRPWCRPRRPTRSPTPTRRSSSSTTPLELRCTGAGSARRRRSDGRPRVDDRRTRGAPRRRPRPADLHQRHRPAGPKGVMLDHANLDAMCRMIDRRVRDDRDDHSLLILPLFHVNGIWSACCRR